jgi:hypothetical protein
VRTITICSSPSEWHREVGEIDRFRCASKVHAPDCHGGFEHAHHIVYKSSLPERAHWILENGIALGSACHRLAHDTKNASLDLNRCNEAVASVNPFLDKYQIPKFKKAKIPLPAPQKDLT